MAFLVMTGDDMFRVVNGDDMQPDGHAYPPSHERRSQRPGYFRDGSASSAP